MTSTRAWNRFCGERLSVKNGRSVTWHFAGWLQGYNLRRIDPRGRRRRLGGERGLRQY